MYILSTSKQTIVSDFYSLQKKDAYLHPNGEETDFQFYPDSNVFLELNKKSGLEILRIKEKNDPAILELQRVRKLRMDKIYSMGCCRLPSTEEIALGLNNGQVKLFNYKSFELASRFSAEKLTTVLFVDYNASDEYVSVVYENGHVNIFGRKTRGKVDSLKLDGHSVMARFHPTKRFQLSIASYKGALTVYDMASKRKVLNFNDMHGAPCRDLCMCSGMPDIIISVGFDCKINILDTRRKTPPTRLDCCSPLSTVAMSDCGTYFCVGNLKGEILSYDMRSLEKYLSAVKVHDNKVNRVAFVPKLKVARESESSKASACSVGESSPVEAVTPTQTEVPPSHGNDVDLRKSVTTAHAMRAHRDSFCDFLDFHANKGAEKMSPRFTTQRESFDWDMLTRHRSSEMRASMSKPDFSPASDKGAHNSNQQRDINITPLSTHNSAKPKTPITPDFKNTMPLSERNPPPLASDSGGRDNLMRIQEEDDHDLGKENLDANPSRIRSSLPGLSAITSSTPLSNGNNANELANSQPVKDDNQSSALENQENIRSLLCSMREENAENFSLMRLIADNHLFQLYGSFFKLFIHQNDQMEEMRAALGMLLQVDPFANEYARLKEENEKLKAENHKLQEENEALKNEKNVASKK